MKIHIVINNSELFFIVTTYKMHMLINTSLTILLYGGAFDVSTPISTIYKMAEKKAPLELSILGVTCPERAIFGRFSGGFFAN